SNDLRLPVAVLLVSAEVVSPPIVARPSEVDFGQVSLGTAPSRSVELLRPDRSPWPGDEPITVECETHAVNVKFVKLSGAAKGQSTAPVALSISPRSRLPVGPFDDTVVIRTKRNDPALKVRVHGYVV